MAYTTTTTTSYGQRLGNSFKGIFSGFIVFLIGTALLWWNEGRTVKNARMLEDARDVAVHIDNVDDVDPSLNGQLIHACALANTEDVLTDEDFGISDTCIRMERTVEYYQWQEHTSSKSEDKLGGKQVTETTHTFKKEWCKAPVESSDFGEAGHDNTTLVQYESKTVNAENVSFGGYRLSEQLISGMSGYVPTKLEFPDSLLEAWSKPLRSQPNDSLTYVHQNKNVLYFGKNPNAPEIGDVRITFKQVNPGMVSVLAVVADDTFESFTSNGKSLCSITSGKVTLEKMIEQKEESNNIWKWALRILGIMLVCGGLRGIFGIFSTILKVVPFLASIMEFGIGLICNIVGVAWSLIVIAIAWIAYRPVLGISLLVAAAAIIGFFVWRGRQKKAAAPQAAPEAAPATPAEEKQDTPTQE